MIATGRHTAICRSIQFGTTKTGNTQCAVEFEIVGDDEDRGGSITWFGFFTEKTFDRSIESLRHMGWTGDDLAELPALAESGGLATEIEIVVDHEEFNEKVQAKVKWVNRVGGGGRVKLEKPIEGSDLRSFAAQMKSRISAAPPRKPAANGGAKRDERDASPPADRDKLPF